MTKHGPSRHRAPIALLLAALAMSAQAQPPASKPNPKDDPELNNPNLAPGSQPLPGPKDEPPPVAPLPGRQPQGTLPSMPAPRIGSEAGPIMPGRFLAEGTFISNRTGTLLQSDAGDIIFVPKGDSLEKGHPPVMLLPCQKLEQMLAAKSINGDQSIFVISGQMFTYRDRQFLLPTIFATRQGGTQGDASPAPAAKPSESSAATTEQDPRVTDLIRDLEQARLGPRKVSPAGVTRPVTDTPATPPITPGQSVASETAAAHRDGLANEGTLITNKRGRLVRMATEGGRLCFVTDNDANSPAGSVLILQPCRVMQQMEGMSSLRGDAMTFRVSGQVMVFGGKNFLMPTFFQLPPRSDLSPRQ
jgi:hypothetical protein